MSSDILELKRQKKRELYAKMKKGSLTKNNNIQDLNVISQLVNDLAINIPKIIRRAINAEEISIPPVPPAIEPTHQIIPDYDKWYKYKNTLEALETKVVATKTSIANEHSLFKKHTDINSGVIDADYNDANSPNGLTTTISIVSAIDNFYKEVGEKGNIDWKDVLLGSVFRTNTVLMDYYSHSIATLTTLKKYIDSDMNIIQNTDIAVQTFIQNVETMNNLGQTILSNIRNSELTEVQKASTILQKNLMLELVIGNQSQFGDLLKD